MQNEFEKPAEELILAKCRAGRDGFKTPGTWGMREDVLLGGYGTTERTPCAVLDLERTLAHPTRYGFRVPVVLASGPTWFDVLVALKQAGEVK